MIETYSSLHNHTSYSNLKLIDSINKFEDLIDYGYKLNLTAVAITDHDCLSSHIKAIKYYNKKVDKWYAEKFPEGTATTFEEKQQALKYKLVLGNEIYIGREGLTEATHQQGEKFYHCILLAKDDVGHEQLRKLSTIAWRDHGYFRVMMRTPTYISDIQKVVAENPGHLICTTACLGSFTGVSFMQQMEGWEESIDAYLELMKDMFEDDFYIELQPSMNTDQIKYNKYMIAQYWNKYKFTIATDSHYLTKDERKLHKEFLQSKESKGNREVDEFYSATYMMSAEEIREYVQLYIDDAKLDTMFRNSIEMSDKCDNINLFHEQIVPRIRYEWGKRNEEAFSWFAEIAAEYNLPNMERYFSREANEADRYLAYLIAEGFMDKIYSGDQNYKEYFERIDEELYHINGISEVMQQPLSDYFNTMSKIMDIVWSDGDSIVGPGRGSGCGSLINYLLGITQLDPLRQELTMPFWRFLHKDRPGLPD